MNRYAASKISKNLFANRKKTKVRFEKKNNPSSGLRALLIQLIFQSKRNRGPQLIESEIVLFKKKKKVLEKLKVIAMRWLIAFR